jgi:hypothetical protein
MEVGTQVDQPVLVFLPDAIVPQWESLAFMEKHKWRVRPMRLRGCPSEVLAIPCEGIKIGVDYTEEYEVQKYEKELPAQLHGQARGNFPPFVPKTDEPNFQGVPEMLEALEGLEYYSTVKYDGSSQTVFNYDGRVGGCSRNLELNTGAVWDLIRRYELETKLPEGLAVQWECVGPGIQKNPLKLKEIDCRVFTAYDIVEHRRMGYDQLVTVCTDLALPMAEVVDTGIWVAKTDDELRDMARGKYTESQGEREGLVVRPKVPRRVGQMPLSFKIINLDYKGA